MDWLSVVNSNKLGRKEWMTFDSFLLACCVAAQVEFVLPESSFDTFKYQLFLNTKRARKLSCCCVVRSPPRCEDGIKPKCLIPTMLASAVRPKSHELNKFLL